QPQELSACRRPRCGRARDPRSREQCPGRGQERTRRAPRHRRRHPRVRETGIPARDQPLASSGLWHTITPDIDSFDPAFAPRTGTFEVGELTTRKALALLRGLKGIDIVGSDVVE